MGYVMNGLGEWWNPLTWGSGSTPADTSQKATVAGNVRYVLQLYQWTRQSRVWFNTMIAKAREAGKTDAVNQGTDAMAKLGAFEGELAPYMQKIDDAMRELKGQGYSPPADWGYRWQGWQGDARNAPAPPPAATPISQEEAIADRLDGLGAASSGGGSSWWMNAVSGVLIGLGVAAFALFLATPIGWVALAGGIVLIGLGIGTALMASPGVQDALRNAIPDFGKGVGDGIGLAIPIVAGLVAWFMLSGRNSRRSR
jgi:hypothetical protein